MVENFLGNTLMIEWPVYIEGSETPLSEMDLTLYIVCNRFKKELEFTVTDNTLSFTFEGKDQRVAGLYDLELWVNEGENNQMIAVQKDAIRLYR